MPASPLLLDASLPAGLSLRPRAAPLSAGAAARLATPRLARTAAAYLRTLGAARSSTRVYATASAPAAAEPDAMGGQQHVEYFRKVGSPSRVAVVCVCLPL